MKIQDFISKYIFNKDDQHTLIRMYKGIEKTEEEWVEVLSSDFAFDFKQIIDIQEDGND